MKLKDKHLFALEDKDYLYSSFEKSIQKVKADKSGACWHFDETIKTSQNQIEQLSSLSLEEKQKMPLYGLTIGVKDLFCIKDTRTTAGSKILQNFVSPYDSHVWKTLREKGGTFGAKLAMDEFAMGSFSNTSYLGKVSIPQNQDRTAGGSSGGSGAAMAAELFDFTVGSDTGGSVRLPASFCSVYGYKPSYGAFSRYGMISYASSLDQAGFLTKYLEDIQYLLESQISTFDDKDPTAKTLGKYSYIKKNSFKVAYFPSILESYGVQEYVKKAYQQELEKLKEIGVEIVPIQVDLMEQAAQIYYIIACSEASSNLARYQGLYFGKQLIEEGFDGTFWEQTAQYRAKYFGLEVQKRIMLGSFVLSSENFSVMYEKAWTLRKQLTKELYQILESVDSIVLPVSPMVAPKWDEIEHMTTAQIYMSDYMTVPFSLAGLPALSTPYYKTNEGLGIGMQWVGKKDLDYQLIEDVLSIEKLKGM